MLLHYQVYQDTIECVDSILNHTDYNDFSIIIVDNASPNKSGRYLQDVYKDNEKVCVMLNAENLGFAAGNNVGYGEAKKQGADFVVQANNDTILLDGQFIPTLLRLYEEKQYGVLGPDIVSLEDGLHQNPAKSFRVVEGEVKRQLIKNRVGLWLTYLNLDAWVKRLVARAGAPDSGEWKEEKEMVATGSHMLHGCCWIFSPIYLRRYDGMFDGTFMYYEENILAYQCERDGIKTLYSPELKLYHKRKAATNAFGGGNRKKRMFYYRQTIYSIRQFLKLYRDDHK